MPGRWGVKKTEAGGVSIGYSSIAAFRRCPRRAYWSLLHANGGVRLPKMPPSLPMLSGSLWHKAYHASVLGNNIREAMLGQLAEEELVAEAYTMLCDEILTDLDWYWAQDRGNMKPQEVLLCEQELKVRVPCLVHYPTLVADCTQCGKHELRGTPDLVIRTMTDSVLQIDHKGHGILWYSQTGSPIISPKPKAATIVSYQSSRQFVFYCGLINSLHPEWQCFDAMLNLVPQQITAVLNILGEHKGDKVVPEITRIPLEPYAPNFVAETMKQAIALCDQISNWWDRGSGFDDALVTFPEVGSSCVGYKGQLCSYYNLDTADVETRQLLLDEAYEVNQ